MFSAKIVADSIDPDNVRLTTFQIRYPRFIHSEIMTHRVFSRNAMSSRAVPVQKMIDQVLTDPAMPVYWGKNQAGMQAAIEVEDKEAAREWWIVSAQAAVERAKIGLAMNLHKQIVNRVLEPFQWMNTIITGTEWENFWELRVHKDAQPEFQKLASLMKHEYDLLVPRRLEWGDWHLPYVRSQDRERCGLEDLIAFSVARCARVSFNNHDGSNPDGAKDIDLHDKLVVQKPAHASPAEHQAQATKVVWWKKLLGMVFIKNFRGFRQYRDFLEKKEVINDR